MEKGFKPQPNCKRRLDGGVLNPSSVRSRAGDFSAVFLLPPRLKEEKNRYNSQIQRFLNFIDDEALSRVRLTISFRIMEAIAVTSNGMESLAAQFWGVEPEPDTRTKLMKSLGKAYCQAKHLDDDVPLDLDAEIRLVFRKLVRSLPSAFKKQAQHLAEKPTLGQYSHFLFQENVTDFYNPMGEISKVEAIASIEENEALLEFFGGNPVTPIADCINEINPNKATIPLRQVHEAAVFAGITAAQVGKINVLALEGNPGIGKTTAVMKFLKQQSQGFLFLYLSPRVVIRFRL
jgi:hypothetical protein